MYGDDNTLSPSADLRADFTRELGRDQLSTAQIGLLDQVGEDFRDGEGAGIAPADLASLLAGFWRFVEDRPAARYKMRLVRALGADAHDLGLDLLEIVQDDAPFLVDSVMGELAADGFDVRAMFHPVVAIARDVDGRVLDPAPAGAAREESLILVALGDVGEDRRETLLARMQQTLDDVHAADRDRDAMREVMRATAAELAGAPAPFAPYGADEYIAVLDWLTADRFIYLGARTYDYPCTERGEYAAEEPQIQADSCLGLLRDESLSVLRRASEPAMLTSQLSDYLQRGAPVIVAKSTVRSRVHRRGYMDYIGVRRYDARGRAVGEVRFIGLFTAQAYEQPAGALPLVRRKIDAVLSRIGDAPSAHTLSRFRNIVETYPRDELFQIDEDRLYDIAIGVLHLFDRPRVRLFVREDPLGRFVSALLYVPLKRYDSELEGRAGAILARAWGGRVSAVYPYVSDQPLVRVHYIVGVTPGVHARPDVAAVEAEIAEAVRTWGDRFETAARQGGVAPGLVGEMLARYAHAFPAGYRDAFDAAEALEDLGVIEGMGRAPDALRVRAYRRESDAPTCFRFKLYRPDVSAPLADVLPILENLGLKALVEAGFPIAREMAAPGAARDAAVTWVHEFVLEDERGEHLTFADVKTPFEDTFLAAWTGRTENDGFNRLVLELGAPWREAALARALARYRQQSGLDPSQAVQISALVDNSEITRLILDMFRVKFDPGVQADVDLRKARAQDVFDQIVIALQQVASLDADRVLRRLAQLVMALTRTNFYQGGEDGGPKPYISFKIASRELEDLPAPKPYREIFVWAPHVEGVHLRFGPVARGGLRWSDRRDDFRTEVLGLVKAQQVKNAVIVPVGSKGGFYPKALPKSGVKGIAAADAVRAEGVRAYKTFLSGLLDLTDNIDASGEIVGPPSVIAHEGADPYLVVAADKGTATFSDIANGVSADYDFWLGDAFASGGSVGYDHKAMGITARGAWEAVKRHFREMGKDIQSQPFTCIGVGDMSGDVFGNGVLLSKQMRLVAAFDHRDVFLDPDPDPAVSWAERNRMFALPRSSWADYDAGLISKGGGVFSRAAKSVRLSAQVKTLLEIGADELSPSELIQAILKAPAELLYLGGIGTYVKAASESQQDAGDKANDAVRIDATDLRVQVVGEGANLGFTQAGRISFARMGGRIDTDAIDNSAGVDTSDHEVNIKILLGQAMAAGELAAEARPALLASMTDAVAAHVLRHNYDQTLGLSLQQADAPAELDAQAAFMLELERRGRLNRKVEGLPGLAALADLRDAGEGLTRPELAVITAYGKLELSADIVASDAPDDPYFFATLEAYFPEPLRRFDGDMRNHRLRREIIATVVANVMVDKVGPTFASRLASALDVDTERMVAAFVTARQVFRLDALWREVDALDGEAPARGQIALYRELARALRGQTYLLARAPDIASGGASGGGAGGVQGLIDAYRPAVDALSAGGVDLLSPFEREEAEARRQALVESGAPEGLAQAASLLRAMAGARGLADLARDVNWPADAVARLYFAVGAALGQDRLRAAATGIRAADGFERQALRSLVVELLDQQVARTRDVATSADGPQAAADPQAAAKAVDAWTSGRTAAVGRARQVAADIEATPGGWTFAKLTIANAALRAVNPGA